MRINRERTPCALRERTLCAPRERTLCALRDRTKSAQEGCAHERMDGVTKACLTTELMQSVIRLTATD